jgi:hypothetical protein
MSVDSTALLARVRAVLSNPLTSASVLIELLRDLEAHLAAEGPYVADLPGIAQALITADEFINDLLVEHEKTLRGLPPNLQARLDRWLCDRSVPVMDAMAVRAYHSSPSGFYFLLPRVSDKARNLVKARKDVERIAADWIGGWPAGDEWSYIEAARPTEWQRRIPLHQKAGADLAVRILDAWALCPAPGIPWGRLRNDPEALLAALCEKAPR